VSITRTRKVFVGEDDASGIIYFATYFHYMSEGDQLLFEAIGTPVHHQIADRAAGPAVHVECDYVAPARAGDELEHEIRLSAGRRSSYTTTHEFRSGGRVVARGRIVRAFVDLDTLRTAPLPAAIRAAADDDTALDVPSNGSRPRS
jgi:4-hydroxybenzoyl-CoA thioesterase